MYKKAAMHILISGLDLNGELDARKMVKAEGDSR